jgi:hypothetical protein
MSATAVDVSVSDRKIFSSLLSEVHCLQEVLNILEQESVSIDEAVSLVSGIQRDIVQLYRSVQ